MANGAGVLLTNLVVLVADLVVMLFALFFFFRDGDAIMSRVRRVLPFDPAFPRAGDCRSRRSGSRQHQLGIDCGAGSRRRRRLAFAVLGLGAPIFWGVMMAFFALLPLGAWVIWGPVAGWLLLTGQVGRGIA